MSNTSRRLRTLTAVGLVAGLALGTAACSKKDEGTSSDGTVKIVLQYFGSPGFVNEKDPALDAVAQFQKANPKIKVEAQNMGKLSDFAPKLAQWLSAKSGAGDVVMLEEGTLLGYLQDNANWADLHEARRVEPEGRLPAVQVGSRLHR